MSAAFLLFEGKVRGEWVLLGTQRFGDAPATVSNNYPDGRRDVYLTQVYADHATLSTLPFGFDIEHPKTGQREIDASQVEHAKVFKRLAHGESLELTLRPDRATRTHVVRYRFWKE